MKKSLRMIGMLSALILVLSVLVPGALALTPVALAADPVEITILHTNDVHARVGVEPYVSTLKKQYVAEGKNVLLLSAGDVLHGQSIATLQRGDSIVEIMNKAGYDAMAPGNHDFNYGYTRLLELEQKMSFPVLGANVQKDGAGIFKAPYLVEEFGGVKVGIFGLATPETKTKTNPLNVEGVDFQDPATVAKAMVTELRDVQGCDVVIALVHLGLDEATVPAERSTAVSAVPGIDLVVDGHSHSDLPEGKTDAGAPIVQCFQYGQRIGEVILTVDVDAEKKTTVSSIKHYKSTDSNSPKYEGIDEDADVKSIITAMTEANKPTLSRVVGHTDFDLLGGTPHTRNAETNLANLITDAMLAESKADVALTNGGGIRDVIPAGDITVDHILTVLPFGNFIVTREVTGANIKAALEFGLDAYPERAGKFPQVAGIKAVFDPEKPKGSRIVSITMADGTPLQDDKIYILATNDFMAVGGDGYTMLNTGGLMAYAALDEAVITYLATNPTIKGTAEGRLRALEKEAKSGWVKEADGWRYYGDDGLAVTGWMKDGNKWYYLQGDGAMKVGWVKDGNKWYYLGSSGAMATGWVKPGTVWYYLDKDGAMKTGWVKDNNKWYYLDSTGAMKVGWVKDDNKWYYLQSNGVMKTGWQKDGSNWYYLLPSGIMQVGWQKDGNIWYYLNTTGSMRVGWLQEGALWYFFKPNGSMAAGETVVVDGRRNVFGANGAWQRAL